MKLYLSSYCIGPRDYSWLLDCVTGFEKPIGVEFAVGFPGKIRFLLFWLRNLHFLVYRYFFMRHMRNSVPSREAKRNWRQNKNFKRPVSCISNFMLLP